MMKRPNLLVLGACGGVAQAFLHHLPQHRGLFNRLVLLDKNKKILSDPYVDHVALDYIFVERELKLPEHNKNYISILKKYKINIVLDLTDYETLPLLEATDACGVHYINTAMNSERGTVVDLVSEVKNNRRAARVSHILCSGMNPGVVNMWVRYGIEKFGVPRAVTFFEYDTSQEVEGWHPMMTWSIHEYLVESTRDPGGLMLGRNKPKFLYPNALENRISMKPILSPIIAFKNYPDGLTVLHEENVTIAHKYNIPSKFVYAVNMKTMKYLEGLYRQKKKIEKKDLVFGDNTKRVLDGSDSIGTLLEYADKSVYYFNTFPNLAIVGSNATYTQVIIGVFAGLFTLLVDAPRAGRYFVEDLFDTHYKYYLFDNMRVAEFVFAKKKGKLKLTSYVPKVELKRKNHFEHLYVL